MTPHLVIMALGLFAGGAEHAPSADVAALNDTEKSLLDAVAAADLAEMQLSTLVSARSTKPKMRALAKTILAQDTANYHRLFSLCLAKTYAIAAQVDDRHRTILRNLQASHAKGALDHVYVDAVLVDQSGLTSTLERVSAQTVDGEIAQFASDTLAMVRRHEQMARDLADSSRG